MDHPYYTATVTNLTRGWAYSKYEGQDADPAEPVHLTSPLTYTWAFTGGVLPGPLDPFQATVNLAAHTADDIPGCQIGDLITIDVRVGATGPRIIAPPPMRVASAEVDLLGGAQLYRARLAIGLVDLTADWAGIEPGAVYATRLGDPAYARLYWRARMAEVGALIGYSVGCPTWWSGTENPAIGNGTLADTLAQITNKFDGKAPEVLDALLMSHQPDALTHTWATCYGAAHPSGYGYVGPSSWAPSGGTSTPIPEPGSTIHIEAVPASRRASGALGWPLTLAVVDGVLEIVAVEPSASPPAHTSLEQLGLDADWCIIPAKARRARDSAFNVVNVAGQGIATDPEAGTQLVDFTTTAWNGVDVAARGVNARDVTTQLLLETPDHPGTVRPEGATVAGLLISDASTLGADWSYDAFTLVSSLIPQDVAEWLLPAVAPRIPGETDGDGRLVRHVTIFDLDDEIRFGGGPVTGFMVGGTLTISGGDIIWSLSTAPGMPQWTDAAPDPITVGEFTAAAGSSRFLDVDPHMRFGDLSHVGAP